MSAAVKVTRLEHEPAALRAFAAGSRDAAQTRRLHEAILDACAEAWNWFVGDADRIRSIGTRPWATVNV